MDLHTKYMTYCTNDMSILEIIDTAFKDDPFEVLHRLVRSYNNQVVGDSLDIKKLQTFCTILCYEYQLRFRSDSVHRRVELEDLCFKDIQDVLFPRKQWRGAEEVSFLYDILLLQMVLYCNVRSVRARLENFRKFRCFNLVNGTETRELYMKGLECFLEALRLRRYLYDKEGEKEYEGFVSLYLEDIKHFITTKDEIQWRSLASIVPKLNCTFEQRYITFHIWNLLLNELKDLKDKLASLNILADNCFLSNNDSKYDIYHDLYSRDRFWLLISEGLRSPVQQYRRWSLFLMKKAVYFMSETKCENSGVRKSKLTPFLCGASPERMNEAKEKYFLVLEALEEKQNHLILPALTHVPGLMKTNKDHHKMCDDCLNIIWIRCIFERMLQHENNKIVKQGLLDICNADVSMYDERFLKFLVHVLNNTFLYELESDGRNESEIVKGLVAAFARVAKCEAKFIKKFVSYVSEIKWGPVAIFYVTHIIHILSKETRNNDALEYDDFNAIKLLVSSNLNMHSPILRVASQNNIIMMMACLSSPINDLLLLANVLSAFPSEEALRRGSNSWNILVAWLPKVITEKTAADFVSRISEKYLLADQEFKISIKTFALMVFLLHDANIIFCRKPCPAARTIYALLSSLIGSDMRPYSDIRSSINVLELMSHFLQFCTTGNCNDIMEMLTLYANVAIKVITKSLNKATITLGYEDFDKFLNIITTFFNNGNLLFSKKEMSKHAQDLQKESMHLFENVDSIRGTRYLLALHIFNICQNAKLTPCPKEIYEFCMINMDKFQVSSNKNLNAETAKGKLMSHYYILLTKLMQNYVEQIPVESWQVEWYKIISNLLQLEGREIVPMVAALLRTIIDKNGLKNPQDIQDFKSAIQLCWRITFLHKKDNIFSVAVKNLVAAIINSKFLNLPDTTKFINPFLTQLLQESENIPNLKRILLTRMELLHTNDLMNFETSLLACLLHGYVTRRDKQIENQAYLYIEEKFKETHRLSITDYNIDATVRAHAMILLYTTITRKPEYASIFLRSILAELDKYKNKRNFKDSHLHRIKHRLMQILLIVEPVLDTESIASIQEILCDLILVESNQHSVRLMQEWLLIRIFVRCEDLHDKLWNFFEESLLKRPGCASSAASIAYHVALLLPGAIQNNFLTRAMPYIARCCLGQNYNMRLYGQVIAVKIYEFSKSLNFHCIVSEYARLYDAALKSLEQGNLMKNYTIKVQDDFYFSAFHPLNDYSLQTIYFEMPRLSTIDADEWIAPDLFQALNFESAVNHPLRLYNSSGKLSKSAMYMHLVKSSPNNKESLYPYETNDNGLVDIQKKVIPIKSVISVRDDITISPQSSIYRNNVTDEGIIIVASLIDRPANLGGLARTCEIFGVKELIIGNLQYTKDREFQNLSVSSDKWINITEVKPHQLCEYLLKRKDTGWDLMGAEQTANSINLLNTKFKKKAILVLGNEKNGIPANIIPLLDVCVEIPQTGFTRSLNVHVTGAICIWQYARQHIFT